MRLTRFLLAVTTLGLLSAGAAAQGEPVAGCPPPPGQPPPPGGCPETPVGQPPQPGVPPPPPGEVVAPQPGEPPVPQPTTPPPEPGPSAGGLTAPPPIEPDAPAAQPSSETEQKLKESEEEDAGRGLSWFYVEAEGGFQHVGLETFAIDRNPSQGTVSAGLVPSKASGGYVGAGLGVQLVFITIGPRFRVGFFPDYQLFSIGGELGFRIPIGIVEPAFSIGGGYAAMGSFSGAVTGANDAISIRGGYGRIQGGVDFFVTNTFAIGVGASWEFLALTRPGVDPASLSQAQQDNLNDAQQQALAAEGSGYGSSVNIGARVGFHL
jgi:hypothetical protein